MPNNQQNLPRVDGIRSAAFLLPNLSFCLVGMSFHKTPIEILERGVIKADRMQLALRDLITRPGVEDGFIISTCNRLEIYTVSSDGSSGNIERLAQNSRRFFQHWSGLTDEEMTEFCYLKPGREAIHHLFSVCSSLDSLVPGEAQILGQVKAAFEERSQLRHDTATTNPWLDRLVRKALSVAKRVRHETKIGDQPVSIAYAAVKLTEKIFDDLKKCRLLVIGTGKMGQLAAKHLKSAGIGELIVCSRSHDNALAMAKEYAATATPFETRIDYLNWVDIVIACTGAPDFVIHAEQFRTIHKDRRGRPLFFIDISLPRNIDPKINEFENVYLYGLEDLRNVVDENIGKRRDLLAEATRLVTEEVGIFCRGLLEKQHDPLIGEIRERVSALVEKEMLRLIQQVIDTAHLQQNPEYLEHIRLATDSLTKKLIYYPTQVLRDPKTLMQSPETVQLIEQLFGVHSDRPGNA